MKNETIIDARLTRPDRWCKIGNGMLFVAAALGLMVVFWIWQQIKEALPAQFGIEDITAMRISMLGVIATVFGIGYWVTPAGDANEVEEWEIRE